MPNNDSHQHVVKTSEQWNDRIVEFWVVPRGCLCVELTPKGKTKIKIGEGNKYYSQLPYICEGHDLSQYYTKDEIDNLFDNLNRMAIMSTDEYDAKSDLPMNDNKLGDVRFVKSSSPSIKSDPDIYLWDGSKWVFVGYEFKDIDLSQYLKKDEFHEMFDPVKEQVDEMYPMRHTHENKDILDQITAPYTIPEKEKLAGLENYDDTEIRQLIHDTGHTHPNKDILDTITSESLWSESDREKFDSLHNYDDSEVKVRIEILESKSHTHDNKDILDQITAPFTTEDKTKLDSLHNDDVFRGTDGMYPGSEGNVPAPSVLDVGKFLSSDGTWKSAGSDVDFIGATSTTDGYHGLVPAPIAGEETYFLRGDGTWAKVKSGTGDKYKAGEGIYILSGEVTSDTFPFEIYSRSQKIKQYIIYGNIDGVGNLVDGKYQIPVRVSAQGYTDRISIITIDDPLYEGDYIDFQKQVFAHYKTNITSQITNPSTDTRATGINSNGELYWKSSFNGWGGAPRVTDYIEIEEGANYEITHTYPSNDFSNALNVNVYDADKNRTRTIITSKDSSTLFSPTANEKYFRYSYCGESDGYCNVLRLKPVETPCILQEIILYPNAINTVNIDTTTKPNEVYFEVEEPEEIDPDDPMAQFSGIIYNDGVLDITQDDPDNLNILTIHFRDDVTKDITINAGVDECVVNITQEDPDNRWTRCDYNANNNVTQNISTGDGKRPLLMSYYQTGVTTTSAQVTYRNDSIYAIASTGSLYATKFYGNITSAALNDAIYQLSATSESSTFNGTETLITSLPSSSGTTTPSYQRITINGFIKKVINDLKEPVLYENTTNPTASATVSFSASLGTPKYLKLFITVIGGNTYSPSSGVTNVVDIDPLQYANGCFVGHGSPGQSGVSTYLTYICIIHSETSGQHTYSCVKSGSLQLYTGTTPSSITATVYVTKVIAVY